MAALRFRFTPPPARPGVGGNHAPTTKPDHSVGPITSSRRSSSVTRSKSSMAPRVLLAPLSPPDPSHRLSGTTSGPSLHGLGITDPSAPRCQLWPRQPRRGNRGLLPCCRIHCRSAGLGLAAGNCIQDRLRECGPRRCRSCCARLVQATSDAASLRVPPARAITSISSMSSGRARRATSTMVSAGQGGVNHLPRSSTIRGKYAMSVR